MNTKKGKVSPWKNSDIKEGDQIVAIDNETIYTNDDVINTIKNIDSNSVILTIERNHQQFDTFIDIATTKQNDKSLGLYIKDKVIGIGTLSFINPNNNYYASLGHGVYDNKTWIGKTQGDLIVTSVESIKKATPGIAGEKRASLSNNKIGTILANKVTGIYGKVNNIATYNKELVNVADQQDIKIGDASIYTVIKGNKVEKFDIKITNVNLQASPDIKGIKFKVNDMELINQTGGIVQGMSGSPIIQNGQIIGAVSHVNVDNPLIGYGMHIEWMIKDMENIS